MKEKIYKGKNISTKDQNGAVKCKVSIRIKIILLAVSFLIGFILAEVGARIYFKLKAQFIYSQLVQQQSPNGSSFGLKDIIAPSGNPSLVYELIPNRYGMFQGLPYRTNSYGMRGPNIVSNKKERFWRIAALGDSAMFGWRVRDEESYPAVLENALNSADDSRQYEVLNFAVPGYNTAIEAAIYEYRGSKFNPDLILLQFDINDLALPNFIQEPLKMLTFERSFLLELLKDIIKSQRAKRGMAQIASNILSDSPVIDAPTVNGVAKYFEYRAKFTPERYRYMVGWEGVKRALDRLWASSQQPILHLSWFYPFSWNPLTDFGDTDYFARYIREGGTQRKDGKRLFYLDIAKVGQDFCTQLGFDWEKNMVVEYPTDWHPSVERHILIARVIYLALVQHRLLPADSSHYKKKDAIAQSLWDKARNISQRRVTHSK